MEKNLKCQAYKVVFNCPECEVGEMMCLENANRTLYSFGPAVPTKKQLAHRCSNCGNVLGLNATYPYLMMEAEDATLKDFNTKGSA